MALKYSLEKNGLFLFQHKEQIPVFIFSLILSFILSSFLNGNSKWFIIVSTFSFKGILCCMFAVFFAMVLYFVLMHYICEYGMNTVLDYNSECIRSSLYCLTIAGFIYMRLCSSKHYTKVLSYSNID